MNLDLMEFILEIICLKRSSMMDGAYLINLDKYSDIGTRWLALYISNNKVTYFDSFGVDDIPKEIKKFIKESIDKFTIVTNVFRIQACDSVMCKYFCIGFIDFMFKGKNLTAFTNLFSPNDFKKSDDIIFKNVTLLNLLSALKHQIIKIILLQR